MASSSSFDEYKKESWYFGAISYETAEKLLKNEEKGTFLIRDCTRAPGYVICVKEESQVRQYPIKIDMIDGVQTFKIREELSFPDIPALLSFYKLNLFETTPLIRPASPTKDKEKRRGTLSDIHLTATKLDLSKSGNRYSDGNLSLTPPVSPRVSDPFKPMFVRVAKKFMPPNAFKRKSWLDAEIGDVIKVININSSGIWLGELNGREGLFNAVHTVQCEEKLLSVSETDS